MDSTLSGTEVCVIAPETIENVAVNSCHSIPCEITFNGEASVSAYFQPRRDEVSNTGNLDTEIMMCSFRGRPLKGQQFKLTDGYEAVLLVEENDDCDVKKFEVNKRFTGFTLWNWDQAPSSEDKTIRGLSDWLTVSEALHKPSIK